jgi:hypothetical protein
MKLHDLGTTPGATTVLDTVTLPDDMFWVDEMKWVPAVSKPTYALTGALVIETASKLLGRPITLQPQTDMAWVSRATATKLRDWASTPKRRFKLVLEYPTDSRQFVVVFRHEAGAIEADPVKGFPQHADDDWYRIILRFVEAE